MLKARVYSVDYCEFTGGHEYVYWRGSFADGLTAAQVYARVEAFFRLQAKKCKDDKTTSGLRAAATLLEDLHALRCPTSPLAPNAWGDPNARLP